MTEAEWRGCENPTLMLKQMEKVGSDRKMRLFECACVRRVWHLLNDERLERVLLGMEHFADGLISTQELKPLHELAWELEDDDHTSAQSRCIAYELGLASRVEQPGSPYMDGGPIHSFSGRWSAALAAKGACGQEEFERTKKVERKQQTVLVRDIFGNPFRPVAFPPFWRTNTTLMLAKQMYELRDFSLLPILGDALMDAGCEAEEIIGHCHSEGPHVRGCWVVDLVLGKE